MTTITIVGGEAIALEPLGLSIQDGILRTVYSPRSDGKCDVTKLYLKGPECDSYIQKLHDVVARRDLPWKVRYAFWKNKL